MGLITAYLALCVIIDYYSAQAIVDLEQAGVLYVCHGGAMSVTCRTNADLLQWNVTLRHPSPKRMFERTLSHIGTIQMETPIITNLTTLSVSRSLDNSSPLPLASTISTNNVTTDLNETVITCSGISMMMGLPVTDNVEVIILTGMRNIRNIINNVAMPSISEQFRPKDILVTLEWTGTNGVSYSVRVDPEVGVNYTGRNSAQITVSYDIEYNISVVAYLCGITMTNITIIHHVTCPPLDSDNSNRVPALVGSVTTFSCPPGMVLTGSNVTTCTTNRQWYPDQNIVCKVDCFIPVVNSNITLKYNSTLEDSLLTFQCDEGLFPEDLFTARCYKNGNWIPNPSNHICSNSSAGANYLIISLSSSFGVLVVLTVMIILPIIIIILFKRKGLWQRNTPTLNSEHGSYNNGGGQVNHDDNQGEYSSGAKQLNEQQSNIKSTYSLVQPHPPEDDNNQQTNSNASTKRQPRGLVYTDVVPFQQEELHVCPFDPNNKIQYSQLKGPSNDFPMQLTSDSSLQMKSHSADHKISLESLLVQLKSAILSDSDKWYQLGKALDTKKELLDKCTRLQPDQSLAEILDDWLRNHSGQPSWNEIAEALTEIGLKQLAYDIKSVYQTGELPIEVDNMEQPPHSQLSILNRHKSAPPIPPKGFTT